MKKPPKAYKKFWEKRFFRLRNGVLYWYKNESSIEAQNKIILSEATDCFLYKENSKFKILINGTYYKFSAMSPKECEQWVQAITKALNREETKNQEEEEEREKAIFVIDQEKKAPLFTDYDKQLRIENNKNLLVKRSEKEKQKQQIDIIKKLKTEENMSTLPAMIINTGLVAGESQRSQNNLGGSQDISPSPQTGSLEEGVVGRPPKKSFWNSLIN